MNFFKIYFVDVLTKRYADFKGIASRTEFWYFILCGVAANVVLSLIFYLIGINRFYAHFLLFVVLFIPLLAIITRRLHDTGQSGWWQLLAIVPSILSALAIVFVFAAYIVNLHRAYGNDVGMMIDAVLSSAPIYFSIVLTMILVIIHFITNVVLIVFLCLPHRLPIVSQPSLDAAPLSVWKKYFVFPFTKQYFDFKTTASRKQYWLFVLAAFILSIIVVIISSVIFRINPKAAEIIYWLAMAAIVAAGISMTTRRLHDADFRGWWQLAWIIPIIFYCILTIVVSQLLALGQDLNAGVQSQAVFTLFFMLVGATLQVVLIFLPTQQNTRFGSKG
ncbi:MAG: DUF805 domain-containing protein [Elusimicrobiota bacterium]|jgi:uncharacterized membrane protein YhaH (DUF805 family)|nr:DUF805 domain-containing protein [Elusimicrobiota bacterium]